MAKDVVIYTIPTCPWCRQTKEYLNSKGIRYTDHDVSTDRTAFEDMYKLTGQGGVPVIVIGGKTIVGFNPKAIDEALSE